MCVGQYVYIYINNCLGKSLIKHANSYAYTYACTYIHQQIPAWLIFHQFHYRILKMKGNGKTSLPFIKIKAYQAWFSDARLTWLGLNLIESPRPGWNIQCGAIENTETRDLNPTESYRIRLNPIEPPWNSSQIPLINQSKLTSTPCNPISQQPSIGQCPAGKSTVYFDDFPQKNL